MDIKEFKLVAEVEAVNTCNGWGFGGYHGKRYTFEHLRFDQTRFSYRHAPSSARNNHYIKDVLVTKKEFNQELEKI